MSFLFRYLIGLGVFYWIFFAQFACKESSVAQSQPNIILIVGDDMGFSDLGCFGGEIHTPHLDTLAAKGLRFTQFYNGARCCPTRASLLTGLYPHQAGVGHMVNDRGTPAFQGDLSDRAVTIAEVLQRAGYATYMSGKWHVTPYVIENPAKDNWPRQRGFDKFFGMISGAGSFYDPRSLAMDNDYVAPREGFYSTTDFTDYAIQCIDEHDDSKPFFLYLSYMAAHWPLQAPHDAIKPYQGRYDMGWDSIRLQRMEKMRQLGVIEKNWEMSPRDTFIKEWDSQIADKEWETANMEVYAAMITLMDQGIGQIVSTLQSKDMFDNTLILFLQDNGACAEELDWVSTDSDKSELRPLDPDQVQTKMIPHFTRDGIPIKLMKDAWPGPPDGYTAYGLNWANVSNTPFREYKHWVHEGGIASPLIAHWPKGIKDPGRLDHVPTHIIDIMATCADISGASYPIEFKGKEVVPMEGHTLAPIFSGSSFSREALYWEHEGNRAIRMGKWKLVSSASKTNSFIWDKEESLDMKYWELYDMEQDRTELHNLAEKNPEIVSLMADKWLRWARRTGAIPRPK